MTARYGCLIATCGLLLGCGGRYLDGPAGDDRDGATSHGGSDSSRAGKASGGAGQGSQGGANPLGGAGAGRGGRECPCDPIDCPPGYEAVPTPTSCCPQCQVAPRTCETQREEHRAFSSQLLAKYGTLTCQTSADCSLYYEINGCSSSCGYPLATAIIAEVDSLLAQHAQATCDAGCPPIPLPPCPGTVVVCKDNRCTSL